MATNTSYQFHNFPKLAEESGFAFNPLRPRVRVDWNRIRSIDIESLIRDRKFYLIEQHISDIISCALDSEFDVRILDAGVIKMFRLAQLAVEYQEFCRHYLDRSINILKEEISALVQELDNCRKMLRERDEELKRLRRKSKHAYRTPLPYGNDNIATMILKTLTNKSDVFQSTANPDARAYNRCNYCDKVFLNQLYLKSHVDRRHPGLDVADREIPNQPIETADTSMEKINDKLNEEIRDLKSKLQQMEIMITNTNAPNTKQGDNHLVPHGENQQEVKKVTKDAEVSTSNEDYVLEKIEEWKKEEYEKYNKEINLLRTQIIDTIQSLKEKEPQKELPKESSSMEHLQITIKQQGSEINALKQELSNSKLIMENEEIERRKGSEAQMLLLAQRTEIQSKQYEALLHKLNEVAREAQESRTLAEKERERAAKLQELLQTRLNDKITTKNSPVIDNKPVVNGTVKTLVKKLPSTGSKSLESLHRKAQELLNIGSSNSDTSSESAEIETQSQSLKKRTESLERKVSKDGQHIQEKKAAVPIKIKASKLDPPQNKHAEVVDTRQKKPKPKQRESEHNHVDIEEHSKNGPTRKHGSPVKLVRAKITEEVNNRLVSIGVDPLKNSLPHSIFKKHRMNFQQQNDNKTKKNPAYLKVRHTILTYLDSKTTVLRDNTSDIQEYASPSAVPRTFSISSVLSNVKSKALSLVKTNDANVPTKRKTEMSRKNISTKSPTESESESSQELSRNMMTNVKHVLNVRKQPQNKKINNENGIEDSSSDSDNKYHNSAITEATTKSIESLIKSPARRPSSANAVHDSNVNTARQLISNKAVEKESPPLKNDKKNEQSSSTMTDELSMDAPIKKAVSVDNMQSIPKSKGVLKNASSTSSLNKKKVLFDMDAIQMKSVSASPSQSINEKADGNEKFELGLINLEPEDWDISSIENEPLNDTKINVNLRTSPKIAELRQSIENQLAHRKETTTLIGGVDVLKAPPVKVPSTTGSNTSLGSSILDESDGPPIKTNAFIKSKRFPENNDSDLDISEYSIDGLVSSNKKNNDSF